MNAERLTVGKYVDEKIRQQSDFVSQDEVLYSDLMEDLEISRRMVKAIEGDTPLKTFHQERIDYLTELLGINQPVTSP